MSVHPPYHERGAALLAVLAMVLLLSGLAAAGLQSLRAGTSSAAMANTRSDLQFLQRSGVEAALQLAASAKTDRNQHGEMPETKLQTAEGEIHIRFKDAGACFNLNSLAAKPGKSVIERAPAVNPEKFSRMLVASGIPLLEAGRIADATAEKMRSGILWAHESEWMLVPGVTASHWNLAGKLLCTLPSREASAFNINALTSDKAPLLVAMGLQPDEARRALASRPDEGWTDTQRFWDKASPAGVPQGAEIIGTKSRWLIAEITTRTAIGEAERNVLLDTAKAPAKAAAIQWHSTKVQS